MPEREFNNEERFRMNPSVYNYSGLADILAPERLLFDEPMKKHTTFQVGGPADCFAVPGSAEEFCRVRKYCREEEIPCFVVGNGSNLLVSDSGYRGVILSTSGLQGIRVNGEEIEAMAGVKLSVLAQTALRESLTGLEFAGGIPGTFGGALYMNAGAYNGEMKQVVESVLLVTGDEPEWVPAERMAFDYRYSIMMDEGSAALAAKVKLAPGDKEKIAARMEDLAVQRKTKQPLEYPSAGSTFKRPDGYFAGKLIQDSGLSGYRVGGACVSPKHCGFVVNDQQATADEIYRLIRDVQKVGWEHYGVKLAMEVKILGDFC